MASPRGKDRSGFSARVSEKETDLIELLDKGLPELDFLPASEGMLVRGHRHLIAAPAKCGKSLATQVHLVNMVEAGASVLILDRENGKWLYANRLRAILKSRGSKPRLRKRLRKCLHYVDFPALTLDDGAALADWALALEVDLVVFDSQRMFLTDLGLAEDRADDYATYMSAAIDPLFEVGIATLILDNTGHGKDPRSRGTSAKRDLNELLFTLKVDQPFSESNNGRLRLTLGSGDSRLGNEGEWVMGIGGGDFDAWCPAEPSRETAPQPDDGSDRAEEMLLRYLRSHPGSKKTPAFAACTGNGIGKPKLESAMAELVEQGLVIRNPAGELNVADS